MKKLLIMVFFINGIYLYSGEDKKESNEKYSPSYMLGVALTSNLGEYQFSKLETEEIIKGFSDGLSKKVNVKDVVNYDKVKSFINEKKQINTARHKKEGSEYLATMAKDPKAKKYDSGLVVIVKTEGKGDIPKPTDKVRVHYKGYFINGKTFDSSYDRGQPVEFVLSGVIPCWTQALTNTKVGSKITIGCPSDIAYGDRGMEVRGMEVIPGGATLLFDIELLDIVKDNPKEEQAKVSNSGK